MKTPAQPPDNACLFLDVDGTLIDLAPTPDSVVVEPGLLEDLDRAKASLGGALALVSGRSIADLDRLFAPLVVDASGVHGAEFRMASRPDRRQSTASALPEVLWNELLVLLQGFPGTLAENKAFSYAVHFRATPESGPRLSGALQRLSDEHSNLGLQILPGHFVYELKRPAFDKGSAIRVFMEQAPFAGRVPIFVGDDITDIPGFVAVKAMGGHGYSVSKLFPEAEAVFAGPQAVRQWLTRVGEMGNRTA